jgi:hypothetical protein
MGLKSVPTDFTKISFSVKIDLNLNFKLLNDKNQFRSVNRSVLPINQSILPVYRY